MTAFDGPHLKPSYLLGETRIILTDACYTCCLAEDTHSFHILCSYYVIYVLIEGGFFLLAHDPVLSSFAESKPATLSPTEPPKIPYIKNILTQLSNMLIFPFGMR